MRQFRNREEAGRELAEALQPWAREHPIVLALPRGGAPIGLAVARALSAPLDVWVVRKVGVPWHPELGAGAVSEGGYVHLSPEIVRYAGIPKDELDDLVTRKYREVEERVRRFRGDRRGPELRNRTIILVDDGIATGGTVRAAIRSLRARDPRHIVLAVPVAAPQVVKELEDLVDDLVCLLEPADLYAIGLWYQDFSQVSDCEVKDILERGRSEQQRRAQESERGDE